VVVFFEDMLGSGVNDWDYNDFVVRIASTESVSGGELTAITIDYEPLARGASYYHSFRQVVPVSGPWTATLTRYTGGPTTAVLSRTTTTGSGPIDMEIFADTRDALAPAVAAFTNTVPSQKGFQPGAQARLEITLSNTGVNPDGKAGLAPWDPYLRLPYLTGPQGNEIHRSLHGGATEVVTVGPLAGTSLDFVLVQPVTTVAPSWSFEGTPVWDAYPQFVPWLKLADPAMASWSDNPTSRSAVFDAVH
jgi:LruC domain-containing protein